MRVFTLFAGLVLMVGGLVRAAEPVITVAPEVSEYTLVHASSSVVPDEWKIIGPRGLLEQGTDWVYNGVRENIVFTGVPGRYYVVVGYTTQEGVHSAVAATVKISGVGPEPGPEPVPPPPPPPLKKLVVVFVYESNDVDDQYPWLANILVTQKIRKLASDKVRLYYADKDEVDEEGNLPANTKAWLEYAVKNNLTLPVMFLANQDGRIISEESPPRTVDEAVAKIRQYIPSSSDAAKAVRLPSACLTGNCPTGVR